MPDGAAPDGTDDDVAVVPDAGSDVANDRPGGDSADGPRRVPYRALAITSGRRHTCVLLDDHNVKCWGQNEFGQLGLGDKQPRGSRPADMGDNLPVVDLGANRRARAIVGGGYNTCAILEDGALKCWGFRRGDEPGEMGDNLPTVDLGTGRSAKLVGMGHHRSCVALDDDTVKCWDNASDVSPAPLTLPSGTKVINFDEAAGLCALFDDGTVRQLRFDGTEFRVVDLGGARASFVAGEQTQGCAVLQTGQLMCWDSSLLGRLRRNPLGAVLSMNLSFLCGMTDAGVVTCEGRVVGEQSALGLPAIALSKAGEQHACAILEDRNVKCWGSSLNPDTQGGSEFVATGWPAVNLGTRVVPGP